MTLLANKPHHEPLVRPKQTDVVSLNEAFQSADTSAITKILGEMSRERGMAKVAKDSGFRRESLYRSLVADGNPRIVTIVKVLKALGLRITVSY